MKSNRVLLVDDNAANARAAAEALRGGGFEVAIATDVPQALVTLAEQTTAVVLVAQKMAGLRGSAFLARCASSHPEVVRVLMARGESADEVRDAVMRGLVFQVVWLPTSEAELVAVARTASWNYVLADSEPTERTMSLETEVLVAEHPDEQTTNKIQ